MKKNEQREDWKEWRRRRAWELSQQGWKQKNIAVALGVSKGAVSQWLKRGRTQGVEALRRHLAPGPQTKLSAEQLAQLPEVLARGAEAFGYRGQVWTTKRVAEVIKRVDRASAIIRPIAAASCVPSSTVSRSPSSGRPNAMRQRSEDGRTSDGPLLQKRPSRKNAPSFS